MTSKLVDPEVRLTTPVLVIALPLMLIPVPAVSAELLMRCNQALAIDNWLPVMLRLLAKPIAPLLLPIEVTSVGDKLINCEPL